MAFRDETEALRSRIDVLERELERAREALARLEGAAAERDRLAARVEELERELGVRPAKPTLGRRLWERRRVAIPLVLVAGGVGLAASLSSPPSGPPTYGTRTIDEARSVPFETEGRREAESLRAGCRGYLPDAPTIELEVSEATDLILDVEAPQDAVLYVDVDGGDAICDDDGGDGLDPRVETVLPAGTHRVFVGTYREGVRTRGELRVGRASLQQAADTPVTLDRDGSPTLTRLDLDQDSIPWAASGLLEPVGVPASRLRSSCPGFVPALPQVVLETATARSVHLRVRASADLVMVLELEGGDVRCDDDGGEGLAPAMAAELPVGTHRLWIGSYARSVEPGARYDLEITPYLR